jgi:two-component system cell cycle response regulator CpdR
MTNDPDSREATFEETERTPRRQLPVLRIAIADDDPDSLELLRLALGNPRVEICEAANGAELVDLLVEEGPFDLVVSDVLMPWMEGLQVLSSARAAEIRTPVLLISGLTRPELQAQVDRLGNAKLLRKPFGIPDLRAAVADLMAAQPAA